MGQPPGLSAIERSNPQTWNRDAYVSNAPLKSVDPSGLERERNDCLGCINDSTWIPIYVDYSQIVMGNTFFDALAGEPGTYLSINMSNQTSFGFSEDLWVGTLNIIDFVHESAKNNGANDLLPHVPEFWIPDDIS